MARRKISAYEAKTHLGQLLRDAEAGASFLIVRRGKPVARLDPVGSSEETDFKDLAARFRRVRERIRRRGGPPFDFKAMINEGRRI